MEHHELSLEQAARLVSGMGLEAILKLASQLPEVGVKFGGETLGVFELFLNQLSQLGPDELEAVKRGDKRLTTEIIIKLLFDQNGRGIPSHLGLTSKVKDENLNFSIVQRVKNYPEILNGYVEAFSDFPELKFLSAPQFEDVSEASMQRLLKDGLVSNLVKRAYMPIPTPHFIMSDYGKALQEIFLAVLKKAYEKHFSESGRIFNNYRDGDLEKKVSIIKGTGYDKFIAMMAGGPNAVWYFPRPLQGFSINADREAMKILTGHSLVLSGAISTSLAITGNVEEMAGSSNTPGYDCAAVSWKSSGYSLYFKANDDELGFAHTDDLGDALGSYSGGLVFLG